VANTVVRAMAFAGELTEADRETLTRFAGRQRVSFLSPALGIRRAGALAELAEPDAFERRFHVVALERMIKALGTFGYQAAVLDRTHYLEGVPRTIARIRRACAMWPDLREVGRCLDQAGLLEHP
jgi:hypothetical protein